MRLDEFQNGSDQTGIAISSLISGLRSHYNLAQMGGKKRVYQIGNTGRIGVIFLLDGGMGALGVAWKRGTRKVATIYIWNDFDISEQPTIAIDVPQGIEMQELLPQLDGFIKSPRVGIAEADEDPTKAEKTKTIKIGPAPTNDPNELDDLTHRLIKRGEVKLVARGSNGEYFFIPQMDKKLKRLDSMLDRHIASRSDGLTMEQQYEALEEDVLMVAGRKSQHLKAMIITGAPSAGKSFRVMKVIKQLGLRQGRDYIMKTGSVTDASLYRLLIEQLNGLIIFDDCDSVWETTKAANFLKGALNTGSIRTINNDSSRTVNIANLPEDERREWLEAASRVLRGRPNAGDLELVYPKMRGVTDHSADAYANYLLDAQAHIQRMPPNQIDFTGRVIFISNLEKEQLDAAVLSRSVHVDLNFSDDEMLDFIETIGDKLEEGGLEDGAEPLSQQQIDEVFTHVRYLIAQGHHFDSPINFRFIQKCFDYRRSHASNWKSRISSI